MAVCHRPAADGMQGNKRGKGAAAGRRGRHVVRARGDFAAWLAGHEVALCCATLMEAATCPRRFMQLYGFARTLTQHLDIGGPRRAEFFADVNIVAPQAILAQRMKSMDIGHHPILSIYWYAMVFCAHTRSSDHGGFAPIRAILVAYA